MVRGMTGDEMFRPPSAVCGRIGHVYRAADRGDLRRLLASYRGFLAARELRTPLTLRGHRAPTPRRRAHRRPPARVSSPARRLARPPPRPIERRPSSSLPSFRPRFRVQRRWWLLEPPPRRRGAPP